MCGGTAVDFFLQEKVMTHANAVGSSRRRLALGRRCCVASVVLGISRQIFITADRISMDALPAMVPADMAAQNISKLSAVCGSSWSRSRSNFKNFGCWQTVNSSCSRCSGKCLTKARPITQLSKTQQTF